MTKTVVGLFHTPQAAQTMLQDLMAAGFSRDHINLISHRGQDADVPAFAQETERIEKGETVTTDTAAGALFGGIGGALLGLTALLIPGLGALAVAGPIASALVGATTGAAGGAIIGALQNLGVNEEDAHVYAESIRRGNTLVAVHADDTNAALASRLLNQHGAIDVEERRQAYKKEGFSRFGETRATGMSPDPKYTHMETPTMTSTDRTNFDDTRSGSQIYPHTGLKS